MTRRRIYFALFVVWVAFIFFLTSIPNPEIELPFWYSDKIAHFGFYCVMGFLCAMWRRASGGTKRGAALAGFIFVAVAGAVDEVHQQWIPGRSMAVADWIADTAGGGFGALCSAVLPSLVPFLLTE